MENQFSQQKLDLFIRAKLERNKGFLNFQKTSIEYTALEPRLKDFSPENTLEFRESKVERMAILLLGLALVLVSVVAVFFTDVFALIFGLFGLLLVVKAWFFSNNYVLRLMKSGVLYNNDTSNWEEIAATLILKEPVGRHYRHYLVLALHTNEIRLLEITGVVLVNEKAMGLNRFLIPEERLISHFVEYYKMGSAKEDLNP